MKKTLLVLVFFCLLLTKSFSQTINLNNFIENVKLDSLTYFVKELTGIVDVHVQGFSGKILSRHKDNAGNNKAAEYIYQKLNYYGLDVTKQVFSSTGCNIYGTKLGTKYPNKKVIICAHYDSMPEGARSPGADDNGSGTSAVIEAARILANYQTQYTMVFALWDEEEQGLVGSKYYASNAAANGDTIIAVLNMDMISWNRSNSNVIEFDTENSLSSDFIVQRLIDINAQLNLGFNVAVLNHGSVYSDHASFWEKDYPAVEIIEDRNDYNDYYHTIGDTLGNFNLPYYHKASQLVIATFLAFATDQFIMLQHKSIASTDQAENLKTKVQINSGLICETPLLYYRLDEGNGFGEFRKLYGFKSENSNNYFFDFPTLPLGCFIQYYIAIQDTGKTIVSSLPLGAKGFDPPGNLPPPKYYSFYYAPSTVIFIDSFANIQNWNLSGGSGLTNVKYVSAPFSITDSPHGNYGMNVTSIFTIKTALNIPEALGIMLSFNAFWDIKLVFDYAMCQISSNNGVNWTPLEGNYTFPGSGIFQPWQKPIYDGNSKRWVNENICLNDYMGKNILLRFYFRSAPTGNNDGFYVDDLKLIAYEKPTGVENNENTQYLNFELFANYPNPFNPATTISYQIPVDGVVNLKVFDVLGREIITLVDEHKSKGKYNINFDASNLASGVYIYQIRTGDFIKANKMILVK